MAGWNPYQKFAMPMFNPWVPERLRPWIYVLFALFFQLSGGIYFSSMQQIFSSCADTLEFLEPQFSVFFFVCSCFEENFSYLFIAFFFCN